MTIDVPAAAGGLPGRSDRNEPMPAEEERFSTILAEYGGGLRRVARSYAASTDEAEDLFQEIALALWRALPSFRGECSARTFAYRVAHNRGLTFHARRPAAAEEIPPSAPSKEPSPEEQLHDHRRRADLWVGIRALHPAARVVLTLALEGLSHEEIADVLGISINNVAVRLSRARADLRERMEHRR